MIVKIVDPLDVRILTLKSFAQAMICQIIKSIFICDGNNDFCLAKNLKKNDVIFPRKDYALDLKLLKEEYKKQVSADVIAWKSGNDIINYLKEI